jgi:hypothetical protein
MTIDVVWKEDESRTRDLLFFVEGICLRQQDIYFCQNQHNQTTNPCNASEGAASVSRRDCTDNVPRGINSGSSVQITHCQPDMFNRTSSSHRSLSHAKANGLVQAMDPMIKSVRGLMA